MNFNQLYAGLGLITGSLNAASSDASVRRSASFLRVSGLHLPWGVASLAVGDAQLDLNPVFIGNLPGYFLPSLSISGVTASFQTSGRRLEFFEGSEYILTGPQITQRIGTGRQVSGFTSLWKLSNALSFGSRLLETSNHSSTQNWFLNNLSSAIDHTISLANQISWQPATSFNVFGELTTSWSHFRTPMPQAHRLSTLAGAHWQHPSVQFAGTYLSQAIDYLPIAGSYLGSRKGMVAEFRVRPLRTTEIFGSASGLESTISLSPWVIQHSNVISLGANTLLGKTSLYGNFTNLSSHSNLSATSSEIRGNQLSNVNVSRQIGKQTFRIGLEDLKIRTRGEASSQQLAELEDSLHFRRVNVGGSLRFERQLSQSVRNQIATRVFWNFNWHFLSAYGSLETGSDLANSSLLARMGSQTTTLGWMATIRRNWQLRADAYRSKLLITLDPQNIALLAQNGVGPAMILNANQWTAYLRLSRSFSWGGGNSPAHIAELAKTALPELSTVEGRVRVIHVGQRDEGPAGIPVQLDRSRFVLTDYRGMYKFTNVPEGRHTIGIDTWHLPADYEPLNEAERLVTVQPRHASMDDFALEHLGAVRGQVEGLPPSLAVVLEMEGENVFTTPENDGHFTFHNVREGPHKIVIQTGSLPPDYSLVESPTGPVMVECNTEGVVKFKLVYAPKAKPVRTIYLSDSLPQ